MFWGKNKDISHLNNRIDIQHEMNQKNFKSIRDCIDVELSELKTEFRNKLEAEKRKNKDLLTEVLSNPPKYKAEDAVFYGDKKYFVYNIKNIKDGDYLYNIYLKDGEGCVVYGSVINDVSERALYTRNKK